MLVVMSTATDFPATTSIGDGITQIRLPMTGNPMRYINGYLLEDESGLILVDCGWKSDDVLAALHAGLASAGYTLADLTGAIITHAHFDHYGLAGTLRALGVRDLLMHPIEWEFARAHFSDPVENDRLADAWIARNGFSIEGGMDAGMGHHRADLIAPTRTIADRERIGRLEALHTPGHTPGHLCFRDTRSGKMLTGDHILDPVTPHVGVWFPDRGNPLGEYIASLETCKAIGASGVLPAHGEPFPDLARRVDELLAHERAREAQVLVALRHAGASSGATVAGGVPWTRRHRHFDDLPEMHKQFAVAETLAHLEYLRAEGTVTRDEADGVLLYAARV